MVSRSRSATPAAVTRALATNTFEGGSDFLYQSYTHNLVSGEKNQVDDSRAIWKSAAPLATSSHCLSWKRPVS